MDICPELQHYAQEHGTPAEEFVKLGWQERLEHIKDPLGKIRPALRFITATGNRWRFTDGEKPKYKSQWKYVPCWSGLARAMRKWPGTTTVYECNGIASTVAAQYRNIAAFNQEAGEGSKLKPNLLEQVKEHGVKKVIVAYDCDETGRRAAVNRVREWRAAGFESEAVDLALDKDGGDLADFLALGKSLSDCKLIEIPAERPKPVGRHANTADTESDLLDKIQIALDLLAPERCDVHEMWYQVGMAIRDAVGEAGFNMWDSWSARSTKYNAKTCEVRWRSFNGKGITIGTLFKWADEDSGGAWRQRTKKYHKRPETKSGEPKPEPEKIVTTPDSLRSGLLSYAHNAIAPTIDVWLEAIGKDLIQPDEPMDVKQLACLSDVLSRHLSSHTIRQGLNQGCEHFFKKVFHNNRSRENTPRLSDNLGCSPGRNTTQYRILSIAQIAHNLAKLAVKPILEKAFPISEPALAPVCEGFVQALGLSDEEAAKVSTDLHKLHGEVIKAQPGYAEAIRRARAEYQMLVRSFESTPSTPIAGEFKNATDYAAAYARSTMVALGGDTQMARSWWATRLGVKVTRLPTVFKRAGVSVVKDQVVEVEITSVEQLRAVKSRFNTELKGFPTALASSGAKALMPFDTKGPMYRWCAGQLESGRTVTLRYRQANKQTLTAPAPVAPIPQPIEVPVPTGPVQLALIPEPSKVWLRWFKQSVEARWMLSWQFEKEPAVERVPSNGASYVEKWLSKLVCLVGVAEMEIARLPKEVRAEAVQYGFQLLLDPAGASP